MARLPPDRLGPPPRSAGPPDAFARFASGGPAERKIHGSISRHGMSWTAELLGRDVLEVARWIRAGSVPEVERAHVLEALGEPGDRRALRYGEAVKDVVLRSTLAARAIARQLGIGHQTVLRWRRGNSAK